MIYNKLHKVNYLVLRVLARVMINLLTLQKSVIPQVHFKGDHSRKYVDDIAYMPDTFEKTYDYEKYIFNYCPSEDAKRIEPYNGPQNYSSGISTEDPNLGGGWLLSDINTPLSTTGVRTCAVLNLVDEDTNTHALYHVFHSTGVSGIKNFIKTEFPHFTHVNIVGGDQYQTVYTMSRIVDAVDEVNPDAEKTFYYTVSDNPELVAYKGNMYYMKGKSGKLSFVRNTENYWY